MTMVSPTPSIHNTEPITMDDVIIIGGSFAGLAGALQLGRARRKITVLDTGLPRNRFAGHSHGLLGHDHKPPLDILAEARQQLARYPTIRLVSARADSVSGAMDDFSVLTGDGESLGARRLILSYGVADQMPDVPGFADSWGTSIVPCPHGNGLKVNARGEAGMAGVSGAGDLATALKPSVTLASTQGEIAGIFAQQWTLV